MARVKRNLTVKGLSGRIGNVLFREYRSGTVASSMPDRSKVTLSPKQRKENSNFKDAVAYARGIIADSEKRKEYKSKLEPGKSVYHAAVAEYMHKVNQEKKDADSPD